MESWGKTISPGRQTGAKVLIGSYGKKPLVPTKILLGYTPHNQ